MFTVEYISPYSEKKETKKFKGKYAFENAWSYAKGRYENYYMQVQIIGFETYKGKLTGKNFSFNVPK